MAKIFFDSSRGDAQAEIVDTLQCIVAALILRICEQPSGYALDEREDGRVVITNDIWQRCKATKNITVETHPECGLFYVSGQV